MVSAFVNGALAFLMDVEEATNSLADYDEFEQLREAAIAITEKKAGAR